MGAGAFFLGEAGAVVNSDGSGVTVTFEGSSFGATVAVVSSDGSLFDGTGAAVSFDASSFGATGADVNFDGSLFDGTGMDVSSSGRGRGRGNGGGNERSRCRLPSLPGTLPRVNQLEMSRAICDRRDCPPV
jgi:hypothetical protein